MLICIFATRPWVMITGMDNTLIPAGAGINDENLADAAPQVRALMVQRLEMIWRACEPQFTDPEVKADPRYIEAGIRVVDRYTRLYRLDHPQPQDNGQVQVSAPEARKALQVSLSELEVRMTGDGVVSG